MSDYLFVYGTLQPGFAPGEIAEAAVKLQAVGRGFVFGEFFELGGYPGAVLDPTLATEKVARMGHGAPGYSNHGSALKPSFMLRRSRHD